MPANIGEMFYFGDVPWHGKGTELDHPANMQKALLAGGLDWKVGMADLETVEQPSSPVGRRVAIVRNDRPMGHPERVVGVVHKGFKPLQNREGVRIFDAIFGKGKRVYHTGGYLGAGEVVWLMAKLPSEITVGSKDTIEPYVLFTNSHDGSIAVDFRLTTIRVVCQNTLSLALGNKDKRTFFKHAHHGDYQGLKSQVESFFSDTLKAVAHLQERFNLMMERKFDDDLTKEYIEQLFPLPTETQRAKTERRARYSYLARVKKIEDARKRIAKLRICGKGSELPDVKESLWGALNAVMEYVDHYSQDDGYQLPSNLFGFGANLKRKAFDLASQYLS